MSPRFALWRLFRYVQWIWLLELLLLFGLTGVVLATGLAIRLFFNNLETNTSDLIWLVVICVAFGQLGQILLNLMGIWLDITVRNRIAALLRKNMFTHTLSKPGANALAVSSSASLARYRDDVSELSRFFGSYGIMDLFNVSFFALINLVVLATINLQITLLVFLPLILVVVIANKTEGKVQQYRKASREATEQVTSFIGEMMNIVQSIKVAKAESSIIQHFHIINDKRRIAAIRDRLFSEQIASIFSNIGNIGVGLILLVSAPFMLQGKFTLGDFAFFVFNIAYVTRVAQVYGTTMTRYQQSLISLQRIRDLLKDANYQALVEHGPIYFDKPHPSLSTVHKRAKDQLQELCVENLSYTFDNGKVGIQNINFRIPKGSFTVITGRVGSGKSTLLRTLLGLYPKTGGKIYWNNVALDESQSQLVPPFAAYLPQVPSLFSESLKDNILMGLSETTVDLDAAIDNSLLATDIQQLENGLETLIGPRGVKLSGGQKQRAATARMLIAEAELYIFDDLSSALDVETEKLLWEGLKQKEGITCLAVSHRPIALRHADQILVLKDGEIESVGRLEELLRTSAELESIMSTNESST